METIQEKIDGYARRKEEIMKEMDKIRKTFQVGAGDAGGCLRLEEVYCVKNGKRYGPFGPYYYVYFHKGDGKLEKWYVGKNPEKIERRASALTRLKQLDREYKDILKQERKLNNALQRASQL